MLYIFLAICFSCSESHHKHERAHKHFNEETTIGVNTGAQHVPKKTFRAERLHMFSFAAFAKQMLNNPFMDPEITPETATLLLEASQKQCQN